MKALITKKVGMTSVISDDGSVEAVTLLSSDPCIVTQIKSDETDGYSAIQLGLEGGKTPSKPQAGHFKQSKAKPRMSKEFRVEQLDPELKVGDTLTQDVFEVGDTVTVTGTSKGKGFAGTIKRHNFHLGRKTHGGRSYRRPGSIGSMYPQKIFKGKKMAGQMGNEQVTVKNLKVALVDPDNRMIGIAGAVPGPRKSIVLVRGA